MDYVIIGMLALTVVGLIGLIGLVYTTVRKLNRLADSTCADAAPDLDAARRQLRDLEDRVASMEPAATADLDELNRIDREIVVADARLESHRAMQQRPNPLERPFGRIAAVDTELFLLLLKQARLIVEYDLDESIEPAHRLSSGSATGDIDS